MDRRRHGVRAGCRPQPPRCRRAMADLREPRYRRPRDHFEPWRALPGRHSRPQGAHPRPRRRHDEGRHPGDYGRKDPRRSHRRPAERSNTQGDAGSRVPQAPRHRLPHCCRSARQRSQETQGADQRDRAPPPRPDRPRRAGAPLPGAAARSRPGGARDQRQGRDVAPHLRGGLPVARRGCRRRARRPGSPRESSGLRGGPPRDAALTAIGLRPLRFTWRRIIGEPESALAELEATLSGRM